MQGTAANSLTTAISGCFSWCFCGLCWCLHFKPKQPYFPNMFSCYTPGSQLCKQKRHCLCPVWCRASRPFFTTYIAQIAQATLQTRPICRTKDLKIQERLEITCGGVFVVVWWCFVVVCLWWCSCGGVLVVVFLWCCFCGGVFVVWCSTGVVAEWCSCGGVVLVVCSTGVVLEWCFSGGVVLWWCFCGERWCGGVCVVVFLFWCGGVFVLVFLWWWWCFCYGVFVCFFLSRVDFRHITEKLCKECWQHWCKRMSGIKNSPYTAHIHTDITHFLYLIVFIAFEIRRLLIYIYLCIYIFS